MLPEIKLVRPQQIFTTGVAFKPDGKGWQYYLPFVDYSYDANRVPNLLTPHVKLALALSPNRALAASKSGELALIDLDAAEVVERAHLGMDLSEAYLSRDGQTLHFVGHRRHIICDAATLDCPYDAADPFDASDAPAMRAAVHYDHRDRYEESPEFLAVVARDAMVTVPVADDSRSAALAALEDLAGRMERDLDALYRCGAINFRFVCNGIDLDQTEFFGRFVRENWVEAARPLKRILMAYLNSIEGGEGCMPWHDGGQAIQALRALVLLDPDAYDAYRLYLEKGDLEHDHSPYELYTEFVVRHGIRHEADVRFGIFLTVMGCLDTDTNPKPLMKRAEKIVTPERFADIVIEEAEVRDDGFWEEYGRDYVKYLGDGGSTFQQAVVALLKARLVAEPDDDEE